VNIREIAKLAEVSTSTVSRVVNHIPGVQPHLAERVWKTVGKMGYFPNRHASALASGRSRVFGLITPQPANLFFPEVIQSFEHFAADHNYEVLLMFANRDGCMEVAVRRMLGRGVDGLAILSLRVEESLMDALRIRKVPAILLDAAADPLRPVSREVGAIRVRYKPGIRRAVRHLVALGHTEIAFVSGPAQLESARARQNAFQECMREIRLKIPPGFIIAGDHTLEGGMRALQQITREGKRPTAVLCSNDMTAIGLLREAYDQGIEIPEDLSVVGIDGVAFSRCTTPPLSTVEVPAIALAQYAFKTLRDMAEKRSGSSAARRHEVLTSFVPRQSTCKRKSRQPSQAAPAMGPSIGALNEFAIEP
jgi:LacI family transcriptional regulator